MDLLLGIIGICMQFSVASIGEVGFERRLAAMSVSFTVSRFCNPKCLASYSRMFNFPLVLSSLRN